ncbi:2-C-methyl-D-erythritol 4-phosphate cytidylyltransferase [Corynebacterium choanae]|uniref:2-C-methyl-D-erythritol 4-phosphate cytidylyltransferase n=1 Tax=Corynebacterium choanae TaxID=1862358 RepID=A0A3G6J497_9CORY|nr:2-C-methyl-D-erythritol 4-phosphate cytidylyltransferase [Corynebacterium choanae]AZA12766.1 2-C-methyl-D-erythritol 4-phosphate cytidylyltransferase [Corynebacterium choanae]
MASQQQQAGGQPAAQSSVALPPTVVVITAAGQGTRLGAGMPKALVPVAGKSLLARSLAGVIDSGVADIVVVTCSPAMWDAVAVTLAACAATQPQTLEVVDASSLTEAVASTASKRGPGCKDSPTLLTQITGGAERYDSVARAVRCAADAFATLSEPANMQPIVLVHDAARALTPPAVFARVAASVAAGHPGVIPTIPVTDTIAVVAGDTVTSNPDRATLQAVQTPQGFPLALLHAAFQAYYQAHNTAAGQPTNALQQPTGGETVPPYPGDAAADTVFTPEQFHDFTPTDDASLMTQAGLPVTVVAGDTRSFKVTTATDLLLAEAMLANHTT